MYALEFGLICINQKQTVLILTKWKAKHFPNKHTFWSDYKVTVHRPISPPHFCVAVAQFKMDAQTVFPHRCDGPDLRYAFAVLRLTSGRTVRHIWWMSVSLTGLREFMWGKAMKAKRFCALFPHSVAEQCHVLSFLGWRAVRRLSGWSTCMRALRRTEVWWWGMSWLRRMETFAGVTVLKVRLHMAQTVPVRTAAPTAHGRKSQLGRRVGPSPMPYRWAHTHLHHTRVVSTFSVQCKANVQLAAGTVHNTALGDSLKLNYARS